jgi:hypothetical protein
MVRSEFTQFSSVKEQRSEYLHFFGTWVAYSFSSESRERTREAAKLGGQLGSQKQTYRVALE